MVKIVLISHGDLCLGLLNTVKMVGGDDFGIKTVPLVPGMTPEVYREALKKVLDAFSDSEILILADIAGGTPYQSALYLGKKYHLNVIAGMNLPLILTLALDFDEDATLDNMVARISSDSSVMGLKIEQFKNERREKRGKLSVNTD
jgi:PTS system mannose-specific IIA component